MLSKREMNIINLVTKYNLRPVESKTLGTFLQGLWRTDRIYYIYITEKDFDIDNIEHGIKAIEILGNPYNLGIKDYEDLIKTNISLLTLEKIKIRGY